MSDEKNDIDTDFEEKLAEIVDKKSRNRTNNNIYERFISRVQGNDDGDSREAENVQPLDGAEKLFAYEPLSTNELELFTHSDSDKAVPLEGTAKDTVDADFTDFDFLTEETSIPSHPTDPSNKNKLSENNRLNDVDDDALDFDLDDDIPHSSQNTESSSTIDSDADQAVHELADNDERLQEKEVLASTDKLASSKKPLIIGMICGSLLITIIVLALIFTGILSTPMQTTVPDTTATISGSNVETEVSTDNTSAVTTPQAPASPIDQPVVDTQSNTPTSANQGAGNGTKVEAANVSPAESTVNSTNEVDADSNSEAAITYEDFREESQNTLYRETSD